MATTMSTSRRSRTARPRLRAVILTALLATPSIGGAAGPEGTPTPAVGPPATCGAKGLPDCPLQSWMKTQVQSYVRTQDFAKLAKALDQLAATPPAGFAGWAEHARAGAGAARASDMAGVRASCKGCHDELRVKYRGELRASALPWHGK